MMDLTEVLASLALAGAASVRPALSLVLLLLLNLQFHIVNSPLQSWMSQPIILAGVIIWALFEVIASKNILGQRITHLLQFVTAPFVAALLTVLIVPGKDGYPMVLILASVALAGILQIVQLGFRFRYGLLSPILSLGQDILALVLVLLAIGVPQLGGILALTLLLFALRQSYAWRQKFGL